MVVRRAKRREGDSEKEDEVRRTLARLEKPARGGSVFRREREKSPQADNEERDVRNNVQAIGNAEPRSLIGEIVIGLVLRDGGRRKTTKLPRQEVRSRPRRAGSSRGALAGAEGVADGAEEGGHLLDWRGVIAEAGGLVQFGQLRDWGGEFTSGMAEANSSGVCE